MAGRCYRGGGLQISCTERLTASPEEARSEVGFQLREVQKGNDPADWKPLRIVGPWVREIRIRDETGAFRVIYLATVGTRFLSFMSFRKNAADGATGH